MCEKIDEYINVAGAQVQHCIDGEKKSLSEFIKKYYKIRW